MHSRPRITALLLSTFLVWSILGSAALAAPALPNVLEVSQPDGSSVFVVPFGDENGGGYENVSGYTAMAGPDGFWYYATLVDGELSAGTVPLTETAPVGLSKHLRSEPIPIAGVSRSQSFSLAAPNVNSGTRPVLVLLAEFTDQAGQTSASDWSASFFGASSSVADYYDKASRGALDLQPAAETSGTSNDGVVGWLDLGVPHPNTAGATGEANRDLTRDTILAADAFVDFSAFDTDNNNAVSVDELHVVVIVAGHETAFAGPSFSCSPSVWAHETGIVSSPPVVDGVTVSGWVTGGRYSQFGEMHCGFGFDHMATIGVMVHEIGHDLGFPDLYDIDGSSNGVGDWSVMGQGSWNSNGGLPGDTPAFLDAFSRIYQGWETPGVHLSGTSDFSLASATSGGTALQILENPNGNDWVFGQTSGTGEYFLLENRQPTGYDAGLPGCGLLLWHIDETRTSSNFANADESRKLVDLIEADGDDDLDNAVNTGDGGDPLFGSAELRGEATELYSGGPSGVSVSAESNCATSMDVEVSIETGDAPEVACDFNGDGFGDVAIGSPGEDLSSNTKEDAGAVTVAYGSPAGLVQSPEMFHQGTEGVPGDVEDGDQFGISVACGDYDGDGFADLAVGSNGEDIGSDEDVGMVTLLYGSSSGLGTDRAKNFHQDSSGIKGVGGDRDFFGEALASGDIDGDGFDDLLIGIPGESANVTGGGSLSILFGSASGLSTRDQQFDEGGDAASGDQFGYSVASGDFNDDGYDDVAVGVPLSNAPGVVDGGHVHVYFGNSGGLSVSGDVIIDQDTQNVGGTPEAFDAFGSSLGAGDINGDGLDDLVVGVPDEAIVSNTSAGAINWLFGSGSGLVAQSGNSFMSQDTSGIKGRSEINDLFGWSITVGDVDGDGFADVLAGVPGENSAAGAVAVVMGSGGGLTATDEIWTQNSSGIAGQSEAGDFLGSSVTLSDLDGDGKLDLIAGASGEAVGTLDDAGAVNILRGGGVGLTASGDIIVTQNTTGFPGSAEAGDYFGFSGAGMGPSHSQAAQFR